MPSVVRAITRFQDADDVQAPAAGATDTGKAWLWNNATGKFEPTDVVTATEGAATYLPLAGGILSGQLTMADGVRINTDEVRARDSGGLLLSENATGTPGIFIQNATGAVAVGSLSPGASTALTVDGRIRSRQVGSTRYRADLVVTTANGNLLSYDDTGAAYIPLYIDGLFTVFRTGAAAEAARFDASGNLVMADTKRIESDEVRARDTGGLLLSENAGAGMMIANSTGQLLVNTSTAITGAVAAAQLQVNKTSPGNALFVVDNTTAANGASLELLRRRSGFGVLSSGDRLGTIAFSGADSIDAALGASIYAEVDGTPGSNDMPGRIIFATTADGANTVTERMRITQDGRVGIATAGDPPASIKLTVDGVMRVRQAGSTRYRFDFNMNTGMLEANSYDDIGGVYIPQTFSGSTVTFNNSGSASNFITLQANGNFGLRTTSQFGSGQGVFGVANAATNPSTNPTGGGVLYANAGAGTWRGSSGTVTAFGPAGPHCSKCGFDFWETCYENETWGATLKRCGWCGYEVRSGPSSVLDLLTPEQLEELI